MKVFIDKKVHLQIESFYEAAMAHHIALDEAVVIKKIDRLYDAMESLGTYAEIYPTAHLNNDWIPKGYQEFICEDFHFAYKIYTLEDGERIVRIHDAVHSLLYH
ncbi:MAG: hypothetical protein IJ057_05935 [Bacteroidales bacterium]|nr:hypothetical protein [Bacteroidales bacterium]